MNWDDDDANWVEPSTVAPREAPRGQTGGGSVCNNSNQLGGGSASCTTSGGAGPVRYKKDVNSCLPSSNDGGTATAGEPVSRAEFGNDAEGANEWNRVKGIAQKDARRHNRYNNKSLDLLEEQIETLIRMSGGPHRLSEQTKKKIGELRKKIGKYYL